MLLKWRDVYLSAAYHQFYVEDADQFTDTGDASFWTEQACKDRLALAPGVIGIETETDGRIHIYTELHDASPPLDLTAWDHVTESGLEVRNGRLRVSVVEGDFEEFMGKPGVYRVRCCHANLAGANDAGSAKGCYLLQVWPAPFSPPTVLKRWGGDD